MIGQRIPRQPKPKIQTLLWEDIRDEVKSVNLDLVAVIDAINLNEEVKFCKVNYPFGTAIFEDGVLFIPDNENNFVPVSDLIISSELKEFFDNGQNPFGMVLTKSISNSFEGESQFIPLTVFYPGQFFGLWEIFDAEHSLLNKTQWNLYSGSRSIFSTTKISNQKKYQQAKRKFDLKAKQPESLKDHFFLFKELVNHPYFSCNWSTTVLFFSKHIKKQITKKGEWQELQNFFLKYAWKQSMVWRFDTMTRATWGQIASLLKEKSIKNFGFQLGVLKHIITISLGALPCFVSSDPGDVTAPLGLIRKILIDEYGVEFYPTIMVSAHLSKDGYHNGYYSINESIPIEETHISKRLETSIETTRSIKEIYEFITDSVINNKVTDINPLLQRLIRDVKLDFFHSAFDKKSLLLPTHELPEKDNSLVDFSNMLTFNEKGSFFRGLVSIKADDFYA